MEVVPIDKIPTQVIQANLFEVVEEKTQVDEEEMKVQQALLEIKNRYGKNAAIRVRDKMNDATQIERNKQIGGHKA